MDKKSILREIMSYYNFKRKYMFAQFLGISSQRLSNWLSRGTYNPKLLTTKCVEFNPEWIVTGKQPVFKDEYKKIDFTENLVEEPENGSIYKKQKAQNIPLYKLNANTSLKNIINNKSKNIAITDFIHLPDLAECDGAIYVKGEFMSPLLKSGDIITFKTLSIKNILWGELYLVETTLENKNISLTIGYIQKSDIGDNFIKITSENQNLEELNLNINKISYLALIHSSIRFH
ncbi:helix-turn-helix domain-containing protein [Apibacter sp. HY039]|uniref:LexA family transcriptional regulator n=1 Tax=Apibacter sp. HY039 TaxID=2501476 RepID=UPI000FEBE57B|nr:helix-turn-helix domain-containing protein [Apibacter sp. HY039]